jgi:hypothetical protein
MLNLHLDKEDVRLRDLRFQLGLLRLPLGSDEVIPRNRHDEEFFDREGESGEGEESAGEGGEVHGVILASITLPVKPFSQPPHSLR